MDTSSDLNVNCIQCFSCEKYFSLLRKIKLAFCLPQPIMNNNFDGTETNLMGKHPRRAERLGHSAKSPHQVPYAGSPRAQSIGGQRCKFIILAMAEKLGD